MTNFLLLSEENIKKLDILMTIIPEVNTINRQMALIFSFAL